MRELDKLAKYLHEIKMPFMQYECNKKFDERDLIFTLAIRFVFQIKILLFGM